MGANQMKIYCNRHILLKSKSNINYKIKSKNMVKIKVFDMFSGYGGAEFALKRAKIEHECIGFSEIDKAAITCFKNNHPQVPNYGDCKKIDVSELPNFDLLTGGFPCQPFSEAGKHGGEVDTRGTLFYDIIRIAEIKKPKYMLLENVKGLTFKNHEKTFKKILLELNRLGYNVHTKIMNSRDYNIPQSRERILFVCIRKDIVSDFNFPKKENLKIFLKDIIEGKVHDKYYISKEKTNSYPKELVVGANEGDIVSVAIRNKNRSKHQAMGVPYGTFPKEYHFKYNKDIGVSYAVKSATHEFMVGDVNLENIRKLTPKECFRLMGFTNDEINLNDLSELQKYNLAGNGWDINLMSKVFVEIFKK
jgi:DNA (cytosine-5)-methyltransferase 1